MMTDITERKRAEYALRRSEERFRNLFESVLEGVYQSTPDGRILAANPMLLQMLGLANEAEINDVNIADDLYVDPHTRQRLLERLEREGGFQNAEYELRRRDGKIITVLENARVVRDENGVVIYYEGTLTDITLRKEMEQQLRSAQEVEALGRVAGGFAHDFHNALTSVTGFAQLALSDLAPLHPARSNTERVLKAADSAMALTRQLLSFSRRQPATEFLPGAMAPGESPGSEAPGNTGETVLLVEDEPLVRELSRDMLERQGCRGRLASNAEEAEEICRRGGFDLLITDTATPDSTGTDLASKLRADHPELKVLFTSVDADRDLGGDGARSCRSRFQLTRSAVRSGRCSIGVSITVLSKNRLWMASARLSFTARYR